MQYSSDSRAQVVYLELSSLNVYEEYLLQVRGPKVLAATPRHLANSYVNHKV